MKKHISLILKYSFSAILCILTYTTTKNLLQTCFCSLELLLIFVFSNLIRSKTKWGIVINYILQFLFNCEMLVLYFGSSFITYIMLENMDSIKDLGGKIVVYSIGVITTLIFSFIPHTHINLSTKWSFSFVACLLVGEVLIWTIPLETLIPSKALYDLSSQYNTQQKINKMIASKKASMESSSLDTYSVESISANESLEASVSDNDEEIINARTPITYDFSYLKYDNDSIDVTEAYEHPTAKPGTNVILIITEGLSQNVIDDYRNIMPNVAHYQSNSLAFTNYFNHTFATYRGLIGQLYSGHQLENYDTNCLPSIMDILKQAGYYTAMINTEVYNNEYTQYLNNLGFDKIISPDYDCDTSNIAQALLDKPAYEELFETASKYHQKDKPFFLVIYTFGTHASMNSPDEIYGDGSNHLLNKFYNNDYQFGKFMEKFTSSSLKEDTMLVYTADHSTFGDEDFFKTFTNYSRKCNDCDSIPFFIYYSNWKMQVDAAGRNSLDMAPTLLTLLDLKAPSSFLGTSLFNPKKSGMSLDTYFWDTAYVCYTGNSIPQIIYDDTKDVLYDKLTEYFVIK